MTTKFGRRPSIHASWVILRTAGHRHVVISRLDYCNSLKMSLSWCAASNVGTSTTRIQNAAVRLIFELTPRDHITPSLLQLHWLSVRWRIDYKLGCVVHSVHTGRCQAYLKNTVQLAAARQSRCDLRSSSTPAYTSAAQDQVRSHTLVRPRGTHCYTPVRDAPHSDAFRKLLKTS